jgi:hypothetical protein
MANADASAPSDEATLEERDPPREEAASWFWSDEEPYLHPTWPGTIAILLSMALGYLLTDAANSATVARIAGLCLLGGIAVSILFDLRVSLKNLIRIDLGAILALFYLTFAEFILANQPVFTETVTVFDTKRAVLAVYLGFAGLVLGRHLIRPARVTPFEGEMGFPPRLFLVMTVGCFFFGNLYAFLAVSFNPLDWLYHVSGARFSQPWSRGKYGNWGTLLGELQLLLFAVPALTGIIFARARHYSVLALVLATVVFLLTLYQGFAGGTRNVLAMNLAGFAGGFFIVQRELRFRPILILTAIVGLSFVYLSHHQLKFRQFGLRLYYSSGMWQQELVPDVFNVFAAETAGDEGNEFEGFFIDLNLRNIAGLTQVFPSRHDYLGVNVPFVALTKPIPRALWPGKPEDFEVGIEEALAADEGYTLSCTFVGEAYMMYGFPGVLGMGLFLGATFMAWNRLGSSHDSVYQRLVFASLFMPGLITMRSFIAFTTYLLVPLFLLLIRRHVTRFFADDAAEDTEEADDERENAPI